MTYETIAAQDTLSDTRDKLNGFTTRTILLPMRRYQWSAGGTSIGQSGDAVVESFTLGDKCNGLFMFPDEFDGAANATIKLYLAPDTSVSGKQVSFAVDVTAIKIGSAVNVAEGTVLVTDLVVPNTAHELFVATITIDAGTYLKTADPDFLGLQFSFERTAPTTAHSGEIYTPAATITYSIER